MNNMSSNSVNTEKWDTNSVILIQSWLAKIHRNMILKRSRFHELITDKNKKILNLGCGSGPFLTYFASRGFEKLYGIEPDTELIKNIPVSINAEIKSCAAESIDFDDCTFDVVFIYDVLHHLKGTESYISACNEICRVLKHSGFLFIMEPGRYWTFRITEIASKFLGFAFKTFRAFSEALEEEKTGQHFFSRKSTISSGTVLLKETLKFLLINMLYTFGYLLFKKDKDLIGNKKCEVFLRTLVID